MRPDPPDNKARWFSILSSMALFSGGLYGFVTVMRGGTIFGPRAYYQGPIAAVGYLLVMCLGSYGLWLCHRHRRK